DFFIGGESFLAFDALAPTTHLIPFFHQTRIDDFRIVSATKWTKHQRNTVSLLYTGNRRHNSMDLRFTASITDSLCTSSKISQIQCANSVTSFSLNPRVVTAGVPMRKPLVTNGERTSPGTVFLFTVMLARPKAVSASLPLKFLSIKLTKNM